MERNMIPENVGTERLMGPAIILQMIKLVVRELFLAGICLQQVLPMG